MANAYSSSSGTLPPPVISVATPTTVAATPTPTPTATPTSTPTPTLTPTPAYPAGPLPNPKVPLFPGDVPVQDGYGYEDIGHDGQCHCAMDVVPSKVAGNNAEVIGQPVNALYTGSLYFQAGDDHRGYLIVGEHKITYSHMNFDLPNRNAGTEQWLGVTEGQVIGTIMDISQDDPRYAPPGAQNHLHLNISLRSNNDSTFDPRFLLHPDLAE
jgi:hypothetical protein